MELYKVTFTNFNFLSEDWKKNTEEERLLGVSLTGIMDNEVLNGEGRPADDKELPNILEALRDHARATNILWAEKLGIQPSAAITCVKPSGTVSQLVDSASGIHPRHSAYYIRTIRQDIKDPITKFLIEQGVPYEPDHTKPESTCCILVSLNKHQKERLQEMIERAIGTIGTLAYIPTTLV